MANFEELRREIERRKAQGLPFFGDTREGPYCDKCYAPVTEQYCRTNIGEQWLSMHGFQECFQNQLDYLESQIEEISKYGVLVRDMPSDQLDALLTAEGVDVDRLHRRTLDALAKIKEKFKETEPAVTSEAGGDLAAQNGEA